MQSLATVFFGTAEIACPTLRALQCNPDVRLVAIVTQPDRPKGRELQLQPSAVKTVAQEFDLPVLQPLKARDPAFIDQILQLGPDLAIVFAYGQILPQSLLDIPRLGCLNIHTSILPRHRGAAPIQSALLEGDTETGVTIMKMDAGLDTGDIVHTSTVPIGPDDNAQTLHDRLAQVGATLIVQVLPDYATGRIVPRPQPQTGITYARRISREDGLVDWTQPAAAILRRLRAFTPWPGLTTFLPASGKPRRLKILEAAADSPAAGTTEAVPGQVLKADALGIVVATGLGNLILTRLQLEGRRAMSAAEFLAGHGLSPGLRFTSPTVTSAEN